MVYILVKGHSGVDWYNGTALGSTHGEAYQIHSHHIFPQSVLYKDGYDPDNHLHRKIVNEIANRAFLTASSNKDLSNRKPDDYLPEVEEDYPGALARQFIPINPSLWSLDKFESFLESRRETIATKLNEFMDALIAEPEETHKRPITELIKLGESPNLEFKSTLQWDVIQNQVNKNLHHSVLKTIAAFLNTNGGTLLIGVEDNGEIYGLENDLQSLGDSTDRFYQKLFSLVSDRIGGHYGPLVKARFEQVNGHQVCVVDVDKAPEQVFMDGPKGKEFLIRVGNTTRALDPEETVAFIEANWA
jgi:hypothetical protein